MDRLDRLPAVLAVGIVEVRVDVHRARPVQRVCGHDVRELGGLQAFQQALHSAAFKLEHAQAIAAAQHLVRLEIVQGDIERFDLDAVIGLHHSHGVVDGGHVDQPKNIDLEQANRLTLRTVPPGDDLAVVPLPQRQHV